MADQVPSIGRAVYFVMLRLNGKNRQVFTTEVCPSKMLGLQAMHNEPNSGLQHGIVYVSAK
jgi:hypothetical protein